MIAIFSHVGFQDAADGASHQALGYFAMTSHIPHTRTFALASSDEAEALVGQAVEEFALALKQGKTPDSYIFFIGRENFPQTYGPKTYKLGEAQVLREGSSCVIAAAGAMVGQALKAAEKLNATVVNVSSINHPDVKTLSKVLEKMRRQIVNRRRSSTDRWNGGAVDHALMQEGVPFGQNP